MQRRYVCSSVTITMRLNAIPTASAIIGGGISLKEGYDYTENNAEDILQYVMDANNNTEDGFINCDIVEILPDSTETTYNEIVTMLNDDIVATLNRDSWFDMMGAACLQLLREAANV